MTAVDYPTARALIAIVAMLLAIVGGNYVVYRSVKRRGRAYRFINIDPDYILGLNLREFLALIAICLISLALAFRATK
jgi:hypothetical protein